MTVRRWSGPLVLIGTVAGVAGIVTYRTPPSTPLSLPGVGGTGSRPTSGSSTGGSLGGSSPTGAAGRDQRAGGGRPASAGGPSASSGAGTVVVQGALETYGYGALSVQVTFEGRRITNVSLASLQVAESLSQEIAQAAIPQLRQEVLDAQSAQIAGVSGATFTSEAYAASVQSAIDRSGR